MKLFRSLLVLILTLFCPSFVWSKVVYYKPTTSPDKAHSVKFAVEDRTRCYIIVENLERKTSTTLEIDYLPIYALLWSNDSQSMVIVGHIARGLGGNIVHISGSKCHVLPLNIPIREDEDHLVDAYILKVKMYESSASVKCKMARLRGNGTYKERYLATYDVNLKTGKLSHINLKEIDVSYNNFQKIKSDFGP